MNGVRRRGSAPDGMRPASCSERGFVVRPVGGDHAGERAGLAGPTST